MIYIIFAITLSSALFAYEETQEWLGTKWGDIREHVASIFHRASLLLVGYLFLYFGIELITLPFLIGYYWLMTDGLMNLMKKRNFLAVSSQSGNPFEKWNLVKFSLIIIGALLTILG